MRKYDSGKINSLGQAYQVILRQPFRWNQMGELQRSDDSDTEADVAGAGRQIVVSA